VTTLDQLALPPFSLAPADIEWVRLTRDAMGAEDRLRQLFVLTLNSDDTGLAAERVQFKVGGVLRDWGADFDRAWQTTRIVIEGSEVPPFIAGDLECGGYGFPCMTPLPNPLGVAAMDDLALSGEVSSLLAAEARAMGFNWSFTPVVDINARLDSAIVGTRSYGSDPERITQQALVHVQALQAQGIAATAKHWPGEGFDFRDQHLVTTVNPLDMDAWRASFGSIYRRLFEAGTLSVMTGHIALPAWVRHRNPGAGREAYAPATVCREINHVLLREVMGFNGLVTSDATSMAGLTSWADRAEAVPQVIQNGCDVFLFSPDAERDLDHMRAGLRKGALTEQRLDDAITRILGLKAKLGLHRMSVDERLLPKAELKERLRQPAAMALADRAASASITLVKDTGVLPLSPQKHRRVVVISAGIENSKPGVAPVPLDGVLEGLRAAGFEPRAYELANPPTRDNADLVLYLVAKESRMLASRVFLDWRVLHGNDIRASMRRFWHELPVVMLSFGHAGHLIDAPGVPAYINAYSPIETVQRAVLRKLLGEEPYTAISPVDAFCGQEAARW
jgi:beta-N-acetylhexosaminidase